MDPAVVKKRGLFSSLKKRRITFTSELKLKIEREDRETTDDGVVELPEGVVGSSTCLIVVSDTERFLVLGFHSQSASHGSCNELFVTVGASISVRPMGAQNVTPPIRYPLIPWIGYCRMSLLL